MSIGLPSYLPAQEPKTAADAAEEPVFANKYVHAVRYVVPSSGIQKLPELKNDSLLVILTGDGDEVWSSAEDRKISRLVAREAVWLRRDETNYVQNKGPEPSKILQIEFKESSGFSGLQVPGSLRDPVNFDLRHFRLLFENQHARVLLLHLDAMETSEEVQLPMHMEVPFSDAQVNLFAPDGQFQSEKREAGNVHWHGNQLAAIGNQEKRSFDELVIELRHPFCFHVHDGSDAHEKLPMRAYLQGSYERIRKQWLKHIPGDVRTGEEKGLVTVQIKLSREGKLDEDGTQLMEVFGETQMASAALRAVREAQPYHALPPDFDKPFVNVKFTFLYNLRPAVPEACEP